MEVLLVRREGWPELHVNAEMQMLEERKSGKGNDSGSQPEGVCLTRAGRLFKQPVFCWLWPRA